MTNNTYICTRNKQVEGEAGYSVLVIKAPSLEQAKQNLRNDWERPEDYVIDELDNDSSGIVLRVY